MSWPIIVALVVIGFFVAVWGLRLKRRLHSEWRIRRAGPPHLLATRHRIWREPQHRDVDVLRFGPGGEDGVPAPPFCFVEELETGSHPCVSVRDARNRLWRVKWGAEAKPEAFCVRFVSACGYFAEVTHYVARGTIEGAKELERARGSIGDDGRFTDARFELEEDRKST